MRRFYPSFSGLWTPKNCSQLQKFPFVLCVKSSPIHWGDFKRTGRRERPKSYGNLNPIEIVALHSWIFPGKNYFQIPFLLITAIPKVFMGAPPALIPTWIPSAGELNPIHVYFVLSPWAGNENSLQGAEVKDPLLPENLGYSWCHHQGKNPRSQPVWFFPKEGKI